MSVNPVVSPQVHISLVKAIGSVLNASWSARNDGDVSGFVRLKLYQVIDNARVERVQGLSITLSPGQTVSPVINNQVSSTWGLGVPTFVLALEGSTDQLSWLESATHDVPITIGRLPPCGTLGDPDRDGVVSINDLDILISYFNQLVNPDVPAMIDVDVNRDGFVDGSDYSAVLAFLNGDITTFIGCSAVTSLQVIDQRIDRIFPPGITDLAFNWSGTVANNSLTQDGFYKPTRTETTPEFGGPFIRRLSLRTVPAGQLNSWSSNTTSAASRISGEHWVEEYNSSGGFIRELPPRVAYTVVR